MNGSKNSVDRRLSYITRKYIWLTNTADCLKMPNDQFRQLHEWIDGFAEPPTHAERHDPAVPV